MRLGSVAIVVAVLLWGASSAGATIVVNTTKDETFSGDGSCSLREAVLVVDGSPSPDCPGSSAPAVTTIRLAPGTYHLSLGTALSLVGPVEIEGTGDPTQTVIDGDHHDRVLQMDSSQATIANVTITGGRTKDGSVGADGTASSVGGKSGGDSEFGGGIDNDGTLNIINSRIEGNATGHGGPGGSGFTGSACGAGGMGGSAGGGGGLHNSGALTLTRVTVTDNSTGDGGAGGGGGSKTGAGAGCTAGPSGTGGNGAGVLNQGSLTVVSSTISGNRTGNGGSGGAGGAGASTGQTGGVGGNGGSGAGIASTFSPLTVTGSTIAGNLTGNGGVGGPGGQASNGGGGGEGGTGGLGAGIWINALGSSSVLNSTVASNTAGDGGYGGVGGFGAGVAGTGGQGGGGGQGGAGGGVYEQQGSLNLASSTIADNEAGGGGNLGSGGVGNGGDGTDGGLGGSGLGGGLDVEAAGAMSEQDTLAASNSPGNCIGTITDGGHNLSFPDISCPHTVTGDPKLSPLADHGGPTQTMGLLSGSAAIGQVPATGAGCPSTDQRGVVRPQPAGGACDIGAYEFAPPVCRSVAVATHGTHPVAVQLSCGDPARLAVQYAIVRRPAHGTLGGLSASAGKVTYTAKSGFSGRDQFTYAASNLNGSASAQTVTVNVARVPLTISGARLSKRRFHVGTEVTFQFTLSLASQVTITITHLHHGRTVTNGSISSHKRAGKATIGFDGTLHGGALVPGSYKATLVASVSGRKSAPVSLSFVIL